MSNINQAKDRIRKLLNLAHDDSAAEGEIDNALRFARKLMLMHNLTEDDVAQVEAGATIDPHEVAAKADFTRHFMYTDSGRAPRWYGYVAQTICELVGTVGIYGAGRMAKRTDHGTLDYGDDGKVQEVVTFAFFGPIVDVVEAKAMTQEWIEVITAMARLKYGGATQGSGRSYCIGFAKGLAEKVAEIKRGEQRQLRAPEASRSTDLMVLSNQLAIHDAMKERGLQYLKQEHDITLRKRKHRSRNMDHNAMNAGKADGRRADLSRNRQSRLN